MGRDNAKARYQARNEAGLCVDCGKAALAGKTLCEPCAMKRRETSRHYFQAMRGAGICPQCGQNNARPGRLYCQDCARKKNEVYHKRRKAGLCPSCGAKITDGRAYCLSCRVKINARQRKRNEREKENLERHMRRLEKKRIWRKRMAAEGRCLCCGQKKTDPASWPIPPRRNKSVFCQDCHYRKRLQWLQKNGKCAGCARPALPARQRLQNCVTCKTFFFKK